MHGCLLNTKALNINIAFLNISYLVKYVSTFVDYNDYRKVRANNNLQ